MYCIRIVPASTVEREARGVFILHSLTLVKNVAVRLRNAIFRTTQPKKAQAKKMGSFLQSGLKGLIKQGKRITNVCIQNCE